MDIFSLFVNEHGHFNKMLQFEVIVLAIAVAFIMTFYFHNNYGFVIILLAFVYYIANMYVQIRTNKVTDFNKITLNKLNKIQNQVNSVIVQQLQRNNIPLPQKDIDDIFKRNKLNYLYIDANMIHFIDSILPLAEYNPREFFLLVKGTNNILRLRYELENFYEKNGIYPENTSQMLEEALLLKRNTVNNINNFIYTVPKTSIMFKYVQDISERYLIHINRNIDVIYSAYKQNIQNNGINANTVFVSYDTTKPFDASENTSVFPYKGQSVVQRFFY